MGLYKTNAHHPKAQWQCCVWCDMPAGCNGNCSSAQHPAVSSLTVRRTVTSISCIWVWASQQVFLYCTRSPCKRNIPWKGPGSLSWALSLWWGSGHSGCFKYPLWAVGHKDKWQHGVWLTERDRKQECRNATLLFLFQWKLRLVMHGSKSRPPLICQLQPKSLHHITARFAGWELNVDFVITFQM